MKWIDLGLPSGTLWASENIKDADGNELFFAFGYTQGYKDGEHDFSCENYEYEDYSEIVDWPTLKPEYDAATVILGPECRMPNMNDVNELIGNTNVETITTNGITHCKVTSKVDGYTDRFLIFPINYRHWTSEMYETDALELAFMFYCTDASMENEDCNRCDGLPVRPVRKKQ